MAINVESNKKLWKLAWENCKDETSRVRVLTILADKGHVASICTLFHSMAQVVIPDEAKVQRQYDALKLRMGETILGETERLISKFATQKIWQKSFDPSWRSKNLVASENFDITVRDEMTTWTIELLHGSSRALLERSLYLIADHLFTVQRSGLSKRLNRSQIESIEESEKIIESLLENHEINPTDCSRACSSCLANLINTRSFMLKKELMDRGQDEEFKQYAISKFQLYEKLTSFTGRYPISIHPLVLLINALRIASMSKDSEERREYLTKACELYDGLQDHSESLAQFLYEILRSENSSEIKDFFVLHKGEDWWLSQLEKWLQESLLGVFAGLEFSTLQFTFDLILHELVSHFDEKNREVPDFLIQLILKNLEYYNLSPHAELIGKLANLSGKNLESLSVPCAIHFTKSDPYAWISLAAFIPLDCTLECELIETEQNKHPEDRFLAAACYSLKVRKGDEVSESIVKPLFNYVTSVSREHLRDVCLFQYDLFLHACYEYYASHDGYGEEIRILLPLIEPKKAWHLMHMAGISLLDVTSYSDAKEILQEIYRQIQSETEVHLPHVNQGIAYLMAAWASFPEEYRDFIQEDELQLLYEQYLQNTSPELARIQMIDTYCFFHVLDEKLEPKEDVALRELVEDQVLAAAVMSPIEHEIGAAAVTCPPEDQVEGPLESEEVVEEVQEIAKEVELTTEVVMAPKSKEEEQFQEELEGIASHKQLKKKDLRRFLNSCRKMGMQVGRQKIKFSGATKIDMRQLMSGFHPIHGTKERPMTELKRFARAIA